MDKVTYLVKLILVMLKHLGSASPIRVTQLQAPCQKQRVHPVFTSVCELLRLHFLVWELNTSFDFSSDSLGLGFIQRQIELSLAGLG